MRKIKLDAAISIHVSRDEMVREDVRKAVLDLVDLLHNGIPRSTERPTLDQSSFMTVHWKDVERQMPVLARRFIDALKENGSLTKEQAINAIGGNKGHLGPMLGSISKTVSKYKHRLPFTKDVNTEIWTWILEEEKEEGETP